MPVSIQLEKLKVTSLDVDFHELTWRLAPTTEDVLDYKFQVIRSESVEGPYDAVSPLFEDRYSFVDTALQVTHRWREYFYKVRVTRKDSGEFKDFGPVSQTPDPDLVATEIRRHIRLLMGEFVGRRCVVLPVRTFGQRCPDCWDTVLEKRTRSGCSICFDTGFVRGYLHPIQAFIQVDPSAKTQQNQPTGTTQQVNTTMRMGFYPPIKPYDLIVEPENIRWRVISQTQTEHSRAALYQELTVHRVHEKDKEYAVPVHFEEALSNLFFTPARNFTNPHSLASFEEDEIPGIFALYPSTYPDHR